MFLASIIFIVVSNDLLFIVFEYMMLFFTIHDASLYYSLLIPFSFRINQMSNNLFWTNMVSGEEDVAGLEDLNFSLPNGIQHTDETSTEVQEIDVHSPTVAPHPRSSRPNSKRSKNFDSKEDLVVVSAWLNISKDPVHGANQSKGTFWSRIHTYFEENKTTPFFRTESSIMHRWMTILNQVNKFSACYEAIERRNQSGAIIQDKVIVFLLLFFFLFIC